MTMIGNTRLNNSEKGRDFMRDMSRGSGKRKNKKKHTKKYACRGKHKYY